MVDLSIVFCMFTRGYWNAYLNVSQVLLQDAQRFHWNICCGFSMFGERLSMVKQLLKDSWTLFAHEAVCWNAPSTMKVCRSCATRPSCLSCWNWMKLGQVWDRFQFQVIPNDSNFPAEAYRQVTKRSQRVLFQRLFTSFLLGRYWMLDHGFTGLPDVSFSLVALRYPLVI